MTKNNDKIMAMVDRRRGFDKNFIEIKIDIKHKELFDSKFEEKSNAQKKHKEKVDKYENFLLDLAEKNQKEQIKENTVNPFISADILNMYVYFFDSMSTRIREFRTIKCAEFFPHG